MNSIYSLVEYLKINNGIIFIMVGVVFLLVLFLKKPDGYNTYIVKDKLLTASENKFYRSIVKYFDNEYIIFAQVRVADVMTPRRNTRDKKWWGEFVKISSKHLDFVLCEPDTLDIVAAIELDDNSHSQANRVKRDIFLNAASEGAGLNLIRIKTKNSYSDSYLSKHFASLNPVIVIEV